MKIATLSKGVFSVSCFIYMSDIFILLILLLYLDRLFVLARLTSLVFGLSFKLLLVRDKQFYNFF